MLRPMPYPDAESLVMVWRITPQSGQFSVAPANFFDWRRQGGLVRGLAALGNSDVTLRGERARARAGRVRISGFFR